MWIITFIQGSKYLTPKYWKHSLFWRQPCSFVLLFLLAPFPCYQSNTIMPLSIRILSFLAKWPFSQICIFCMKEVYLFNIQMFYSVTSSSLQFFCNINLSFLSLLFHERRVIISHKGQVKPVMANPIVDEFSLIYNYMLYYNI